MEHRIGKRRPLGLDVHLSRFGRKLGRFRCSNISAGGMGLQASDQRLEVNSLVMVELPARSEDGAACKLRIRAVVVHQSDGITGLMWIDNGLLEPALLAGSSGLSPIHEPNADAPQTGSRIG